MHDCKCKTCWRATIVKINNRIILHGICTTHVWIRKAEAAHSRRRVMAAAAA